MTELASDKQPDPLLKAWTDGVYGSFREYFALYGDRRSPPQVDVRRVVQEFGEGIPPVGCQQCGLVMAWAEWPDHVRGFHGQTA